MTKTEQKRFTFLLSAHFVAWEALRLSRLSPDDPAVRAMVSARKAVRAKFERLAAARIASGAWGRSAVPGKWLACLSRLYTSNRWRVQEGPRGAQQPIPRGSPNPFAMYRHFIKLAPPKKDDSPWEGRAREYKTRAKLIHGLVAVQRMARQFKEGKISAATLRQWVGQKKAAITRARGPKRAELRIQLRKLEALL